MIIQHTAHFDSCVRELPPKIKKKAEKALRLLIANPWHPSLHIEKIDSTRNIWSGRIDRGYRFTFQWISGGILLRKVGSHQSTYRKP